jgi:hypothetical protein
MHVVEKCLEPSGARGLAQFAQGLCFDLANALAGDGERAGAVQLLKTHAGIALQPFQVGAMPPLRLAVIFLEFFAARALNLPFQVADPAVERAHDVHSFIRPIDHAFTL